MGVLEEAFYFGLFIFEAVGVGSCMCFVAEMPVFLEVRVKGLEHALRRFDFGEFGVG